MLLTLVVGGVAVGGGVGGMADGIGGGGGGDANVKVEGPRLVSLLERLLVSLLLLH